MPSLRRAKQVQRRAHLPRPGMCIEFVAMAGMPAAETLRYKALDLQPCKLRRTVTEQLASTRVCATNEPMGIGDEDGIRRNLEEVVRRCVSELGPTASSLSHCVRFRGIRRAHS